MDIDFIKYEFDMLEYPNIVKQTIANFLRIHEYEEKDECYVYESLNRVDYFYYELDDRHLTVCVTENSPAHKAVLEKLFAELYRMSEETPQEYHIDRFNYGPAQKPKRQKNAKTNNGSNPAAQNRPPQKKTTYPTQDNYNTSYKKEITLPTTGQWFLTIFILAIPIVNIIALIVWATGKKKSGRKNFAKAMWIWIVIGIVIAVVSAVVVGAQLADSLGPYGEAITSIMNEGDLESEITNIFNELEADGWEISINGEDFKSAAEDGVASQDLLVDSVWDSYTE